jgi:hypothetical protein
MDRFEFRVPAFDGTRGCVVSDGRQGNSLGGPSGTLHLFGARSAASAVLCIALAGTTMLDQSCLSRGIIDRDAQAKIGRLFGEADEEEFNDDEMEKIYGWSRRRMKVRQAVRRFYGQDEDADY